MQRNILHFAINETQENLTEGVRAKAKNTTEQEKKE